MRLVFLGTGEIALPSFRALLESSHEVVALVTQPDRPVGRKSALIPPSIKVMAQNAAVAVLQPERVRDPAALAELAALQADVFVVMAYGQILPQALIELPRLAIINLHASLLPKYRGASCLQAPILRGETETGWTVMHVVRALDAGDIITTQKISIEEKETGESLHDRMALAGPELLLGTLELLEKGTATRTPQCESASTYAPKLEREDGRLDWSQSAMALERMIRAYHSWPGTFASYLDAKGTVKRLKIFPPVERVPEGGAAGMVSLSTNRESLQVACGEGSLLLHEVQPEGSKRMTGLDFLRGNMVSQFLAGI